MPSHPTYSSVAALPGVPTVCSSYGELCGLSGSSANAISGAGGLSVTLQQHLTMIIPSYTAAVMLTSIKKKVKECIVLREIHLRTTGRHLSMGSQCYLPPDRGDRPAFTPTGQVGTRFIDPVRMKG